MNVGKTSPVVLSPTTATLLPTRSPKQTTYHHNGLLLRDVLHVSFIPLSPHPLRCRLAATLMDREPRLTLFYSSTVPAALTLPARARRARAHALLAPTRLRKRKSLYHHARFPYDLLTSALPPVIALSAFGRVHYCQLLSCA
jgi:hypothetical protein